MAANNASLPFPLRKANPGIGVEGKVVLSNGSDRRGTEAINVIHLAAAALEGRGHAVARHDNWLQLRDSGLVIMPQIVGLQILERGVHSVTTIQVHHAKIGPEGVFEFQHASADSVAQAMQKGFDDWAQVDLVALLDALNAKPTTCMTMELSLPPGNGKPARWRRAVLSPVAQFMVNPPPPGIVDPHPFCPCCFLTQTYQAFKQLFEGDGFYALRLFGARAPDGTPEADCRVNGENWGPGFDAIRSYVKSWKGTGYEFRKQYVVLQDIDGPSTPEAAAGTPVA